MFERFTDRARRAVVLAQEEARLLNHNYIGTEHMLLGLVAEAEGVAAQVLTAAGLDLSKARVHVEQLVGRGHVSPSGHIPFTPPARTVLEHANDEAAQLNHKYIGTEHLLLGLLREGEGLAVQVLTDNMLDLAAIRRRVHVTLQRSAPAPAEEDEFTRTIRDFGAKYGKGILTDVVSKAMRTMPYPPTPAKGAKAIHTKVHMWGILPGDEEPPKVTGSFQILGDAGVLKLDDLVGPPAPPPADTLGKDDHGKAFLVGNAYHIYDHHIGDYRIVPTPPEDGNAVA